LLPYINQNQNERIHFFVIAVFIVQTFGYPKQHFDIYPSMMDRRASLLNKMNPLGWNNDQVGDIDNDLWEAMV